MSNYRTRPLPPRNLLFLASILIAACGTGEAQLIDLKKQDEKIDLEVQLPGAWDRVCILMPYATSGQAEKLLGFSYFPELHSSIGVKDDRTLLVTAKSDEVVGSFEVLRKDADFAKLGPSCYQRSKAVFKYTATDGGWNEVSIP